MVSRNVELNNEIDKVISIVTAVKDVNGGEEYAKTVLLNAMQNFAKHCKGKLNPNGAPKRKNYLEFTKEELSKMKYNKQVFYTGNTHVFYTRKPSGLYVARMHRKGVNVEVSCMNFNELKERFMQKYNEVTLVPPKLSKKSSTIKCGKTIGDYIKEFLDIKENTTKPTTYKEYKRMAETDVMPTFANIDILQITRSDLQQFLFTYVKKGKYRTAQKLHLLLKCVLDLACTDLQLPNPMKNVVLPHYESKKGNALTYEEEQQLVTYCLKNKDTDWASGLLVLLYFGLRKSELKTINIIDNTWLECETSKERMGRNVVKRRIPFTPMVKQILEYIDFEKAKTANLNTINTVMKRIFANHHCHELRYTFITRCKECGVNFELVMEWDGHSYDKSVITTEIDRGYTDYSNNYKLSQAEKVNYMKLNLEIPN